MEFKELLEPGDTTCIIKDSMLYAGTIWGEITENNKLYIEEGQIIVSVSEDMAQMGYPCCPLNMVIEPFVEK